VKINRDTREVLYNDEKGVIDCLRGNVRIKGQEQIKTKKRLIPAEYGELK